MGEKDKKDYKGITLIKSPTEVSHLMKTSGLIIKMEFQYQRIMFS